MTTFPYWACKSSNLGGRLVGRESVLAAADRDQQPPANSQAYTNGHSFQRAKTGAKGVITFFFHSQPLLNSSVPWAMG